MELLLSGFGDIDYIESGCPPQYDGWVNAGEGNYHETSCPGSSGIISFQRLPASTNKNNQSQMFEGLVKVSKRSRRALTHL